MPKRYIIAPAWIVTTEMFADPEAAEAKAAHMVEKDRVPRVVLAVHSHLSPSPTPRVDVTRFDAEVPDAQEA